MQKPSFVGFAQALKSNIADQIFQQKERTDQLTEISDSLDRRQAIAIYMDLIDNGHLIYNSNKLKSWERAPSIVILIRTAERDEAGRQSPMILYFRDEAEWDASTIYIIAKNLATRTGRTLLSTLEHELEQVKTKADKSLAKQLKKKIRDLYEESFPRLFLLLVLLLGGLAIISKNCGNYTVNTNYQNQEESDE